LIPNGRPANQPAALLLPLPALLSSASAAALGAVFAQGRDRVDCRFDTRNAGQRRVNTIARGDVAAFQHGDNFMCLKGA
jgi:hypothetical protein